MPWKPGSVDSKVSAPVTRWPRSRGNRTNAPMDQALELRTLKRFREDPHFLEKAGFKQLAGRGLDL